MTSQLLPEFKSKEACPACGKHKLYTNDSEKADTMRQHCLSCNHITYENEAQKEFRKKREKANKKDQPSSSLGITIIAMIMLVVLALVLEQKQDTPETAQPVSQIERLN